MKRIMIITQIVIPALMIALGAAACTLPAHNDLVPIHPIYEESADAEPIPVSIAVGAPHVPVYLNFDLAQALGYFAAEGLDVDLQYFEGGSDAVAALESGAADFSGNSMDHVLTAQINGRDLRMLMNFLDHPCATLLVRSDLADEIPSPAELRGRTVGVSRLGSATHILTVFVAAQAGVSAADFAVVEVGVGDMPNALRAGTIDAALGVAPYSTRLIDTGEATVLVDLCQPAEAQAAIGGGLPFTGVLTRADVIATRPQVVQKVVNALVKAQLYITSHTAPEIVAALPADAIGDDAASYSEALEATLPAFSQAGGLVEPAGLERFLQLHKTFGTITDDAQVDLDALYDNQFVSAFLEANQATSVSTADSLSAGQPLTVVAGGESRTFTVDELKTVLPVATITVDDVVYDRPKTYAGFWLSDLIDFANLLDTQGDMLLFRAADGYEIRIDMAELHQSPAQPLVAFRDAEAADGWEPFPKGKSTMTPAPFYLVWRLSEPLTATVDTTDKMVIGAGWSWIYQLTAIEVIDFATTYDRLYSPAIEEDAVVYAGFKRFTKNCLRCHSLNLQGGTEGPELNIPQNITEYRDHDTLVAFIKNPNNFRLGSKMPAMEERYSDAEIESILAYIGWMADHKWSGE